MRLEQLAEQTVTANERIRQSEETRRDCEQKVSSLRSQSRELSARKETHAREAARLDERLQAAGSERDQVVAKLWESYELTPTMAVQQVSAPEDPAEAERRLTAVRSRIRGLGSVNVGAVEEYEEVSQRYSFLSAQLDDVEKSKRELGRLIEELTSQMLSSSWRASGRSTVTSDRSSPSCSAEAGQNCCWRTLLIPWAAASRSRCSPRARSSRTWRRSRAANRPLWRSPSTLPSSR